MPEKITLSGASAGPIPGASDPASPLPGSGPKPAESAPITLQGTVSEQDAIGASGNSKINTISGFGAPVQGAVQTGQSVSVGGLVDGKLAVEIMDSTLPALFVFLTYKIGVKLRKTELQLTEKEKSVLAPIVTKCLETLMINFNNPWAALGVTLIAFYGAKAGPAILVGITEKKQEKMEGEARKEVFKKMEPVASVAPPESMTPASVRTAQLPWEPTDEMVRDKMKAHKYSRKRSIEILKVLHKQGKI